MRFLGTCAGCRRAYIGLLSDRDEDYNSMGGYKPPQMSQYSPMGLPVGAMPYGGHAAASPTLVGHGSGSQSSHGGVSMMGMMAAGTSTGAAASGVGRSLSKSSGAALSSQSRPPSYATNGAYGGMAHQSYLGVAHGTPSEDEEHEGSRESHQRSSGSHLMHHREEDEGSEGSIYTQDTT